MFLELILSLIKSNTTLWFQQHQLFNLNDLDRI
jgi:hypothetical protein